MGAVAALGCLANLAEAQGGLLTTRQAAARGVARRDLARLTQSGGLERVTHGVYRVGGAPRPRLLELRAAWLQLAPGLEADSRMPEHGAVSHASATLVYQVGLLEPWRHEFTVPSTRRRRSRRDDVVIHSNPIPARDVTWLDQILVTTPARMVSDLCAARADGEHLAGVVLDLLGKHLADADELAAALAPHARGYGAREADGHMFLSYLFAISQGGRG
jgi:predicted transcriptional regulator of viral defense system